MRKDNSFWERVAKRLDILGKEFSGGFFLLLSGEGVLSVHGRARILVHTPEEIVLSVAKKRIRVIGKGLFCNEFSADCLRIIGTVEALMMEKGGQK